MGWTIKIQPIFVFWRNRNRFQKIVKFAMIKLIITIGGFADEYACLIYFIVVVHFNAQTSSWTFNY